MVKVAQLVRAPDCGPGGRGFNPHLSPQFIGECSTTVSIQVFQTWDESSILSTRTTVDKRPLLGRFLFVKEGL